MNLLITGATGFIGSSFLRTLLERNEHFPTLAVRQLQRPVLSGCHSIEVGNIQSNTDWSEALSNIDVVVHLAARVHIMNDQGRDSLSQYREDNTFATLNLAKQAASCGVKRFVFLSSIKVNGEYTVEGMPFTADQQVFPSDPYSISKCEAESGLRDIADRTGMETVIIRPPLIYGPGVKANFERLMRLVYRSYILPLGAINNRRSMLAIDNLVDLIHICLDHPAAGNETLLASDNECLSTTQLISIMADCMDKKLCLLPVPARFFHFAGNIFNKRSLSNRLCRSLEVDFHKTRRLLDWEPPVSLELSLKRTVDAFIEKQKASLH